MARTTEGLPECADSPSGSTQSWWSSSGQIDQILYTDAAKVGDQHTRAAGLTSQLARHRMEAGLGPGAGMLHSLPVHVPFTICTAADPDAALTVRRNRLNP